jgi:hypothetical protein
MLSAYNRSPIVVMWLLSMVTGIKFSGSCMRSIIVQETLNFKSCVLE